MFFSVWKEVDFSVESREKGWKFWNAYVKLQKIAGNSLFFWMCNMDLLRDFPRM